MPDEDQNGRVIGEVIDLIDGLISIVGSDGIAFYDRIEIRKKIREKLAELDCEEEVSSPPNLKIV